MATGSDVAEGCETADGKTDAQHRELAHRKGEFKGRVDQFSSAGTIEHLVRAGHSVQAAHASFDQVKDFLAGVAAQQTFDAAPARIPTAVEESAVAAFMLQSADYERFTHLLGTRPHLSTNGAATPAVEVVPIGTS
jgi:hypothetical protein